MRAYVCVCMCVDCMYVVCICEGVSVQQSSIGSVNSHSHPGRSLCWVAAHGAFIPPSPFRFEPFIPSCLSLSGEGGREGVGRAEIRLGVLLTADTSLLPPSLPPSLFLSLSISLAFAFSLVFLSYAPTPRFGNAVFILASSYLRLSQPYMHV